MRICFVLPTLGDSGGVSIAIQNANKLAEIGHDIDIFRPVIVPNVKGWRYKKIYDLIKLILWIPLNLVDYNKKKYSNDKVKILKILTLNNLPKDYDIYVATWWETAYFVNKIENKRKIYFIQGFETWNGNEEMVKKTYAYKGFEIVTICEYLKQRISEFTKEKINILYNDVNLNKFHPMEKIKENNSVGVIYREQPLKGFINFINYLDEYKRDDISYYIVGRNIPEKYARKFDHVFNGDKNSEMELFYNKIGLLIITSEDEGFGLPIIEAMMCKTPVAVKKIGIAFELVENRVNSFLMKSNTPVHINDVINQYLSLSEIQKSNVQNAAYKTVHTIYNELVGNSEREIAKIFNKNGEKNEL